MDNLKVMLGVTIIGLSVQVCASTMAEVPESSRGTAHVLASVDAQTLYEHGIDLRIKKKFSEAFETIKQAATAGCKRAQYTVGSMYLGGIGTDINIELAFDYYEMCCNEIAEAANQMGAIYEGLFSQACDYQDDEKALKWYEQASKLGLSAGKDNFKRLKQVLEIS